MKSLFTLCLAAALIGCQPSEKKNSSEITEETPIQFTSYGAEITNENASDISDLSSLMMGKDSAELKLSGVIDKTCKMKGCWMTVRTGDSTTMRVTFENYGFFVPKEGVEGVNAVFEGKIAKNTTSVDVLIHYAQDEGKSAEEINAITEPKEEFTFVATGVLIEDSGSSK